MVRRNLKAAVLGAVMLQSVTACGRDAPAPARAAPAFTHTQAGEWLNSEPLDLERLRGKVLLVEFWTFECINCLRSADWFKKIAAEKATEGLTVIGVHTPELPQERDVANVRAAVKRLGITYPVMIDGDFSYWKAMNNRYWPAFYLIDREGKLRSQAIGEMHVGERRATAFEEKIDALIKERA
jgi:thiol-disulfide isomerase/thioredoxin